MCNTSVSWPMCNTSNALYDKLFFLQESEVLSEDVEDDAQPSTSKQTVGIKGDVKTLCTALFPLQMP